MVALSPEEFDAVIGEALESLPELFLDRLENVEIAVRDVPGPEAGRLAGPGLLGLYQGVPLSQRNSWSTPPTPDRIFLYQRNLQRISRTRAEAVEQIRVTLLHEIGHHLGFGEAALRELGL